MQTLFAHRFGSTAAVRDPEEVLEYLSREFEGESERKRSAESEVSGSTLAFAFELLNGVLANEAEIREVISKHAPEWPFDKIAGVDRAILEIAVYEMLHSPDVPPVVALDEAIELAKTYGNESSSKFVNGVLNALLKNNPKTGQR